MADVSRSHPGRHRRLRRAAALVATCWIAAPAAEALAAWSAAGSGFAVAVSASVPGGPTPSVSVVGRNVTVAWPVTTLPGGDPVSGYTVRRTSAGGSTATAGASCDGVQTGLSCTEAAVAPGTWSYGVATLAGSWSGAEGTRTTVVVAPRAFTLTSGSVVTAVPSTVTGTISSYAGPATLSFRLDNAATGQLLAGTPATVPADGRADVTVTLPQGVADGAHTIYAIGSGDDAVGAALLVDPGRPTPVTLTTADGGGTPGAAEAGDSVSVTFSEPLRASSLCAAWADDGTAKSLSTGVTVSIANNGQGNSTDVLSVAAPGCGSGGFHFGTLNLGAKGFAKIGTTATFGATGTSSTIGWNPATATLTVVLGSASDTRPGTVPSTVAVYTPDPAITDLSGLTVTGTASRSGRQL